MAQSIILKRSALPGKVPNTGSLNVGEIAINTYDGKLFIKRSGNLDSIEGIVVTNSTTTGSITLTRTGSFGELVVMQDANISRDLYVTNDIIGAGDIDVSGDITGSSALLSDSLIVRGDITGNSALLSGSLIVRGDITGSSTLLSGSLTLSGSQTITNNLTVLGEVNARQFNISVISSSIIFQSGSTKFGDTSDDIHSFTGSVSVSGSLLVNGTEVGVAPGPNTFDFNLDPEAAGTVNFIQDSTANVQSIARTGSFDVLVNGNTHLSVSASAINVTTGSITANYMHLAKYINEAGDLDFNI
jgi:cytoskeletal protein CcmA (bactofilin family)